MSSPATRFDRGNGPPCPDCGYALRKLDWHRDACPTCGVIVERQRRAVRLLRRHLGAHEPDLWVPDADRA